MKDTIWKQPLAGLEGDAIHWDDADTRRASGKAERWSPSDAEIINEVKRHCPFLGFEPQWSETWRYDLTCFDSYLLVRLADGPSKDAQPQQEVYGLLAPFDFHPLDPEGKAFEHVRAIAPLEDTERARNELRALIDNWRTYITQYGERVRTPQRVPVALPVTIWRDLDAATAVDAALMERLRKKYDMIPNDALFRLSQDGLSCYPTYRMVEVIQQPNESDLVQRRAHLLVKCDDNNAYVESSLINGQSSILHDINAKGDLRLSDSDPRTVFDYVRLFCWAIESDSGPFYVPHAWGELNWTGDPSREQIDTLNGLRRTAPGDGMRQVVFEPVPEDEQRAMGYTGDAPYALKTPVAYGDGVFMAYFDLKQDGAIGMVKDEGVVGELPLRGQVIKADPLRSPFVEPTYPHYLLERYRCSGKPPTKYGKAPAVPSHDLADERGVIRGMHFTEPLTLDLTAFSKDRSLRACVFVNCRFERPVHIVGWDPDAPCDLVLLGCEVQQGVTGNGAVVHGAIQLAQCTVRVLPEPGSKLIALDLENAVIKGDLMLWDCALTGRLYAPGLHVDGAAVFRGLRIANGAEIPPVFFKDLATAYASSSGSKEAVEVPRNFGRHYALCLDGCRIEGDLEVSSASREKQRSPDAWTRTTESYDAPPQVAGPSSDFNTQAPDPSEDRCSVLWGGFSGRGMTVEGDATFYGTLCQDRFSVENATFQCTVSFFYSDQQLTSNFRVVQGDMRFDFCEVKGALIFGRCLVEGDVSLYSANVNGYIEFTGLQAKDLSLVFSTIRGYTVARRLSVAVAQGETLSLSGDLELDGSSMNMLEIYGGRIAGKVEMRTGTIGRLSLIPGAVPMRARAAGAEQSFMVEPCRVGALEISAVEIKETMDISGLQVILPEAAPDEAGAPAAADPGGLAASMEGVALRVTQCTIGRDLRLFLAEDLPKQLRFPATDQARALDKACKRNEHPTQARLWGHLDLKANRIGGDLDLRNIDVKGEIRLNDTQVGLDLIAAENYLDPTGDAGKDVRGLRSRCEKWNSEKLVCGGDVDLSGLHVKGELEGRGMDARGVVCFVTHGFTKDDEDRLSNDRRASRSQPAIRTLNTSGRDLAYVGGNLDLTALRANHLKITGDVFRKGGSREDRDRSEAVGDSLCLERAQLGLLEIIDPTPGSIDLSKVKVDRWAFGTIASGNSKADHYIRILQKMDPDDRAVWVEVEAGLRNAVQDGDANRIYVAMRKRGRKSLAWWEKPWDVFKYLTTGYQTTPWRLVGVWFLILVLSVIVFDQEANVEYARNPAKVLYVNAQGTATEQVAMPERPDTASLRPSVRFLDVRRDQLVSEGVWGIGDAFVLALRYHVPVLDLHGLDQWQASQHRMSIGPVPLITAEAYAMCVTAFSYVCLSMLLIYFSSKALRGKH